MYAKRLIINFMLCCALENSGRAILTEHSFPDGKNVVIINVYCPRADKENKDRVNFKLRFYKLLQERAEALVKERRYVIFINQLNNNNYYYL